LEVKDNHLEKIILKFLIIYLFFFKERLVNDYFLIALKDSSKASMVLSISSSL
jgi:hypothetical protein